MKHFLRSKLVMTLAAFVMLVGTIAISLAGSISHSHAAAAPTLSNIQGNFFSNPNDSGAFTVTSSNTPVFSQAFQAIYFNPSATMQSCTPNTSVNEGTRPFTDVYPATSLNGPCQTVIAQNSNGTEQAGSNDLNSFETEFTANLTVPSAGTMTSNITADDGFILAVGSANGQQPTPGTGNPMNNAPSTGPFTGYQVMGANNQPSSPNLFTITTNFPAAGTYPIELDYTECCGATLTLVMSNSFVSSAPTPTPTPTLTPLPSPTPPPVRQKLFILLQGINTTLSPAQAKTLTIPVKDSFGQQGGIYPFLSKSYPGAQFRMFSYNGADTMGNPSPYLCQDTFTQHLSVYVARLKAQVSNYLNNHPNTDVYLIGHSMGGAVALGLLADMKINGFLNTNGGRVAGIVSLDSPMGGTDPLPLGVNSYFTKGYFQGVCPALVPKHKPLLPMYSLDDLFNTFGNGTPHGGVDSIMIVINGGDFTNQEVATAAVNANSPVLTIGNPLDFVYTNNCPLTISDFPSTQWVADQGNNSGVYGRVFVDNKALLTCTNVKTQVAANHFHVLTNTQVENGLQQFINGQTPNALAVAPNSP